MGAEKYWFVPVLSRFAIFVLVIVWTGSFGLNIAGCVPFFFTQAASASTACTVDCSLATPRIVQ